ncbi:putative major royal jelly protein, partial [Trypoxylus dichotomus]
YQNLTAEEPRIGKMLPKTFLVIVFGVVGAYAACDRTDLMLRPIEWTGGPFEWQCGATKELYANSGKYIGKHCLATRCQIYKDECILALPRYKAGCPVTLAKVSLKPHSCEATLVPFPCWTAQEEGNPEGLVSVVDIFIDCHEILWALDCGVVHTLETPIYQDWSYKPLDYNTWSLNIPKTANRTFTVVLPKAVLVGPCCKRDVLYIALVQKGCGNNFLIFSYLSSNHVFSIRTDYLRTGSTAGRIVDLGHKPHKIVILGTDLGSCIFFRYEGCPEVYRWDTNTPFIEQNFVAVHTSPNCLLATCVCADLKRQRVRLLESNFPDYIQCTVGCGALQMITVVGGCT